MSEVDEKRRYGRRKQHMETETDTYIPVSEEQTAVNLRRFSLPFQKEPSNVLFYNADITAAYLAALCTLGSVQI
ncbi:unnamed protein product [Onchocerca flexuosa]|uniref:CAF1C_H4-bd domain-containing protein n=1 Tax=Onchocerca flexuosa TaxID=387005 RepID=A0A183H1S2_9BILA|nr:unnamed protein product [Onchocerca flexuosa]